MSQNRIEKLITELCPNGVEYFDLGGVIKLEKGRQLNRELLTEDGLYPAYNGGVSYSGFTDIYNYNENTIIISQGGASAGFVNFVTRKFYANAHCYVILPKIEIVNNRFVFHFLKLNQALLTQKQQGAGIPGLKTTEILELKIPVPPLPIQQEIVKILDSFTELEADLEAELEMRRKQFEYYRMDLLLTKNEGDLKSLGDIYDFQYGEGNTIPNKGGEYPVFGGNRLAGQHYKFNSEDAPVIGHIGAYAGIVNWVNGKHFVTYNGVICKIRTGINPRFGYHLLMIQDFRSKANS